MRDPTRGGVAATLVEIASRRKLGIELESARCRSTMRCAAPARSSGSIRCSSPTKASWSLFVPEGDASAVLGGDAQPSARRTTPRASARVTEAHPGRVVMKTAIGGQRILDLPFGETLPRIC